MIEFKGVTYLYQDSSGKDLPALKNINLQIEKGQFIGMAGHTGSGKSTMLTLMNGLKFPSEGSVLVDGEDTRAKETDKSALRQRVGLVFQYPETQLFEETVIKDIAFGPKNLGLSQEEVDRRVEESMEMVGLTEEEGKRSPFELSGGQMRRVAIAGVLAMEPSYLVLDEPTSGLDPRGRDSILNVLKRLHQESGLTIVLVSHSMEDISNYCQRLIILDDGEIFLDGTPKEVFSHADELKESGLDVPEINSFMACLAEKKKLKIPKDIIRVEEAFKYIVDHREDFSHV